MVPVHAGPRSERMSRKELEPHDDVEPVGVLHEVRSEESMWYCEES